VHHLRDPGGTHLGEAVRELLLRGRDASGTHGPPLHPRTELLLFFASRMQLAHERIRPAMERGEVVVCERWISSTFAYQACASGEDGELVLQLGRSLMPDVFPPSRTLLLDLDPEVALERARRGREALDLIESRGPGFHEAVRRGFRVYAERFPRETSVLDVSAREPGAIHREICALLGLHQEG
jgi:dTMP kinase